MSLRLPVDLHAEVQETSALAGRSMNDEIIYRLRAYRQATTLNDIAQQNAELKKMLQKLIDRQG